MLKAATVLKNGRTLEYRQRARTRGMGQNLPTTKMGAAVKPIGGELQR